MMYSDHTDSPALDSSYPRSDIMNRLGRKRELKV